MNTMIRTSGIGILLLFLFFARGVAAENGPTLNRFAPGTYASLLQRMQGTAFLLVFWSLDCPPCHTELKTLARLRSKHPEMKLVLVSTDDPEATKEIRSILNGLQLSGIPNYVFPGKSIERIRYEVDSQWQGELPRSYLFDAQHARTANTGLLNIERLETWIRTHTEARQEALQAVIRR